MTVQFMFVMVTRDKASFLREPPVTAHDGSAMDDNPWIPSRLTTGAGAQLRSFQLKFIRDSSSIRRCLSTTYQGVAQTYRHVIVIPAKLYRRFKSGTPLEGSAHFHTPWPPDFSALHFAPRLLLRLRQEAFRPLRDD